MANYVKCEPSDVPENIRFDVPLRNQGQIVEVAFGVPNQVRSIADDGDPYMRITDHGDGSVQFYKRS